jgi:hypothetical protein
MTDVPNLRAQWSVLEESLLELRPLFALNESQLRHREWFDEYIDHNEFEIALHRLVDFLLEPSTPRIGLTEIEMIGKLHTSMQLIDRCCIALSEKSRGSDAESHVDLKHPYL